MVKIIFCFVAIMQCPHRVGSKIKFLGLFVLYTARKMWMIKRWIIDIIYTFRVF